MTQVCQPFKYDEPYCADNPHTPLGYSCQECGESGLKLYREYMCMSDHVSLTCFLCTWKKSKTHKAWGAGGGNPLYQVAGKVAAVPTEDGSTFWGYSSVPTMGVAWFNSLPAFKR